MLASRGIIVTDETIRQWTLEFAQTYANTLRRRKQTKRGDKWFLDEVVLTIKGQHHYLWRAVDQDGFTLDILMQSRCNRHAAMHVNRHVQYGKKQIAPIIQALRKLEAIRRNHVRSKA